MCKPKSGIIFCTCEHEKIDSDISSNVNWTLYRHIKEILDVQESIVMGVALMSQDMLEEGLTINGVLECLNNSHAFDFDYQPKQQDILCLTKREGKYGKSMFFCYESSSWKSYDGGFYDYIDMTAGYIGNLDKNSDSNLSIKKLPWTDNELIEKAKEHIKEKEHPFTEPAPPLPKFNIKRLFRLLGINR